MKYSDLPVRELNKIRNNDTYIICSNVKVNNETKEVLQVDKLLLDVSDLASKEEVMALSEQNAKLIKIINQLVTKNQELEQRISNVISSPEDLKNELDMLMKRLDDNVVEL